MRRNIILINRFYWPDESATAQLLTDLAEHLANAGYDVNVITGERGYIQGNEKYPRQQVHEGVQIHRLSSSGAGRYRLWLRAWDYLLFYLGLVRLVRRIADKDSLLITLTDPPLVHSWLRLFFPKLKSIHWSMDVFPEIITETTQSIWKKWALAPLIWLRNRSLAGTPVVVSLSEEMGQFFKKSSELSAVIPNWSPVEELEVSEGAIHELRSDWDVSEDDVLVGYSGNLGHVHDSDTVYEALAEKGAALQEIPFVFVGGGKRLSVFRELGSDGSAGLQFVPFAPREMTANSLSAIDIHWLSLYPQFSSLVFPSKFAGICSVGRPCIFVGDTECELARMIVEHGLGLVVRSGDADGFQRAVLNLVSDKALRDSMGANAISFYQEYFSKKSGLEKWEQLIKDQLS
ncbi:MAG: glycosyltransferase family 4 protein [Opitutales bacterium]